MKKYFLLFVIMAIALTLSGCCLIHEWVPVSCAAPQTCAKCGLTKGEALPHTWEDATCMTPKTCVVCNTTEGNALGHTWINATCTEPKTCKICLLTEGNALGHNIAEEASFFNSALCATCNERIGQPKPTYFEENNIFVADTFEQSTVKNITSNRFNQTSQEQVDSHFSLVSKSVTPDTDGSYLLVNLEIQMTSTMLAKYNYFSTTIDVFDLYTGQEFPDRTLSTNDEFDHSLTLNLNNESYLIDYSEESISDFGHRHKNDQGEYEENVFARIFYTFRIPNGYDGLVLGISSLSYSEYSSRKESIGEIERFALDQIAQPDVENVYFYHIPIQ